MILRIAAGLMLGVLAFIAIGGLMSAVSGRPPLRGRMVDIGGRSLRLVCEGPADASPTVLLESGAFGFAADWAVVQQKLAFQGLRSCAYDRAGMGYSDPGPAPRDGTAITDDLQKLLAAAHEEGPFVLVGHSMAGIYLRLHAARMPDKVKGVVLVDAATPEADQMDSLRHFVSHFSTLSNLASLGASAGLFKPLAFAFGDKIGVTDEAAAEKRWAFAHAEHNRTSALEVEQWLHASEQARAAGAFPPSLPVAVVTAGEGRSDWKQIQSEPARSSHHGYVENVGGASHATLLGRRYADAIVKGVDHVIQAAGVATPSAKAAAE